VLEQAVCQGRSADIAHAHKQNFHFAHNNT